MFATLHKPLVDDLAGKVLASLDVNGFLHDGIGTTAQGLSSAILNGYKSTTSANKDSKQKYLAGNGDRH